MTRTEVKVLCESLIAGDLYLGPVLLPYCDGPLFLTLDENSLKNPQSVAAMHWRQKGAAVADLGSVAKLLSLVNLDNSSPQSRTAQRTADTTTTTPARNEGFVRISYSGSRREMMTNVYATVSEDISGTLIFPLSSVRDIPESSYDAWDSLESDGHYPDVDYENIEYHTDDWETEATDDYSDMISSISYTDRNGNSYNLNRLSEYPESICDAVEQMEQMIVDNEPLTEAQVTRAVGSLS